MSYDAHDPKWTAYVLGELNDVERSEVEAELAVDPAARAFVAELRGTVGQLTSELAAEPCPVLNETQRERVLHKLPDVSPEPALPLTTTSGWGRPLMGWWLNVAALIFISVGLTALLLPAMLGVQGSGRRAPQGLSGDDVEQLKVGVETYSQKNGTAPKNMQDLGIAANTYHSTHNSFDGRPNDSTIDIKWKDRANQLASDPTSPPLPASSLPGIAGGGGGGDGILGGWAYDRVGFAGEEPALRLGKSDDTLSRAGQDGLVLDGANTFTGGVGGGGGAPAVARSKQLADRLPQLDAFAQGKLGKAPAQGPAGEARRPALVASSMSTVVPGIRVDERSRDRGEVDDLKELQQQRRHSTAAYDHVVDNRFLTVAENPLSTFSTDVDTASYSIVRRFLLQQNQLPPAGAVRIEELVNYFPYAYWPPTGDVPFSVATEVADCPWQPDHRLVRFGLKGREIDRDERPASNLVFLIDVSGSMESPNKLPLVQQGLRLLVEQLRPSDHVAIVVYAGQSGLVLPSTAGSDKDRILAAIEGLRAGGSTNGAQGIEAAYEVASQNFIKGGTNRVLLATDGDFNVGVTSQDALVRLIEDKAKTGVFLTALGFGYDNLKDSTLEKLADKGNGQYAYVDDLREARKIFVDQLSGTLVTIAKDVKIQIEFNPAEVASYRLIGYENRILAKEDFNNDKKDAGDIGAGHTVTALYEIVPVAKQGEPAQGAAGDQGPAVDPLKYQKKLSPTDAASSGELLTLKLRYKQPDGDTSRLIETPVRDAGKRYGQASVDFRFAAGVAAFGMVLRNSPYKGNSTMDAVLELVREGRGSDQDGYRVELISLVERAKSLGAR